jgi:hypothetical protein
MEKDVISFSYYLNVDICSLQINSHHSKVTIQVLSGRLTVEKIDVVLAQIYWPFRRRIKDYGDVGLLVLHRNSVAKSTECVYTLGILVT